MTNDDKQNNDSGDENKRCGVVMPISTTDGCVEAHWAEVKDVLFASIEAAEFTPSLVSDADEIGVIHARIVSNLYTAPIVVCDVSAKNPNVMFELGLRLAFDKPTVIVKDDKTSYSFDTSPIEHIGYRRDLRFQDTVDFKDKLTKKIIATHNQSKETANYSPFLGHFGTMTPGSLGRSGEITKEDIILQDISELKRLVLRHNRGDSKQLHNGIRSRDAERILISHVKDAIGHDLICRDEIDEEFLKKIFQKIYDKEPWYDYYDNPTNLREAVEEAAREICPPF